MKVAFVGKGGSGKTTLASLFVRHIASCRRPVLAFDADINQHLAAALGADEDPAQLVPALGDHLDLIKDYLRGSNPLIPSAEAMIKTTPPGHGSRLLRLDEANPIYAACVRNVGGVRFARAGEFADEDLGVACYHSKVGAVELMLNHLLDEPGEYAVVDMTAGADAFASGLFTRFDVTFLVCEPTMRSVGVYRQYREYARDYDVRLAVIGNKVCDAADEDFLHEIVGPDLLATVHRSDYVRAAERGVLADIDQLEQANRHALAMMLDEVDRTKKDWTKFQAQAVEFHLRNAKAWAGEQAASQVDPQFTLAAHQRH